MKGRLIGRARRKKLAAQRQHQHEQEKKKKLDAELQEAGLGVGGAINELFNSCLEIECEAGGTCVEEETVARDSATAAGSDGVAPGHQAPNQASSAQRKKRVRCRCPLGRRGFFCEKRKLRPRAIAFARSCLSSLLANAARLCLLS